MHGAVFRHVHCQLLEFRNSTAPDLEARQEWSLSSTGDGKYAIKSKTPKENIVKTHLCMGVPLL